MIFILKQDEKKWKEELKGKQLLTQLIAKSSEQLGVDEIDFWCLSSIDGRLQQKIRRDNHINPVYSPYNTSSFLLPFDAS